MYGASIVMPAAGSAAVEPDPAGAVEALADGATETLGATLGATADGDAAATDGALLAVLAAGLADPPQAVATRAIARAAAPVGASRDSRVEITLMERVPS